MSGIVWLASFPKSGDTWMRALLTNYLSDLDEPASINDLADGPIASARVLFDEWVGVEASSLDRATTDRLRTEVYRCVAAEATGPLFMKVHDAWTLTDSGEPMFPADVTTGVAYIVRNPLDVAASAANHYGDTIAGAVERVCDTGHLANPPSEGLPEQLRQWRVSWSHHVRSWMEDSGLAVHVVRYEDLLADTTAVFTGVVRFAGLDINEARIKEAVAFSAFDELRRQEGEFGFRERPAEARGGFFRRGVVGS